LLVCIVEALIPQGRLDEARQTLATATSLLSDEHDLDAVQRQARGRACIELPSGDLAVAERAARAAVEPALQADDAPEQASNWLVLAQVLHAAGRESDARPAASNSLAIAEQKGHALFAWRARSMLTTRRPASPNPSMRQRNPQVRSDSTTSLASGTARLSRRRGDQRQ
jgi:ATP/maltotriose-dependent transcriptional regulator MalT